MRFEFKNLETYHSKDVRVHKLCASQIILLLLQQLNVINLENHRNQNILKC